MRICLIECASSVVDLAKPAITNAGGIIHGIFQDVAYDLFWIKTEIASCDEVSEGSRIPVVSASIEEVNGNPVLRVGTERDLECSFRLVQEVK